MDTLSLHGHTYALGLYWQTLGGTDKLIVSAKAAADNLGAITEGQTVYNVVALRPKARQAGFAEVEGSIPAHLSLAACLAQTKALAEIGNGSWIVRLRLPDNRMWVGACVDGNIVPEGDFAGDESAVLDQMNTLVTAYGDKLGQPIEIDNPEQAVAQLTDWVMNVAGAVPRLRSTAPPKRWPYVALGFAVVVIVLAGLAAVHEHAEHVKAVQAAEQAAAARAKVRAELDAKRKAKERAASRGPVAMPVALLLAKCANAYGSASLSTNGWVLTRWLCTGQAVTTAWKFAPGAAMDALPDGAHLNARHPKTVVGSEMIDQKPIETPVPPAKNRALATQSFYSTMQQVDAGVVSLEWRRARPPSVHSASTPVLAEAKWSFTLSQINPFDIAVRLASLPGLTITQVAFNVRKNSYTWKIEGNLYASQ